MSSTTFLLIAMTLAVEFPMNHASPVTPQWPKECEGKSYCEYVNGYYYPTETMRQLLKNVKFNYVFGELQQRDGFDDVASCPKYRATQKIYFIKDENDEIRYVPQTDLFNITVAIEECKKPGRVTRAPHLKTRILKQQRVDCSQKMVHFYLPVLSKDGKSFESVVPKGGISLSCSAKVINTQ